MTFVFDNEQNLPQLASATYLQSSEPDDAYIAWRSFSSQRRRLKSDCLCLPRIQLPCGQAGDWLHVTMTCS